MLKNYFRKIVLRKNKLLNFGENFKDKIYIQ